MDRFTRNSYPGVLCAAVILLLTGLPGSCFPRVKPELSLDKVVHLLMYLGFAFITLWGYRKPFAESGKAYRKKALWITLVVSIAFGALTELMQEFLIPTRYGSVYDWIADAIGSIFGVLLFYFLNKKRNKMKIEAFCK